MFRINSRVSMRKKTMTKQGIKKTKIYGVVLISFVTFVKVHFRDEYGKDAGTQWLSTKNLKLEKM